MGCSLGMWVGDPGLNEVTQAEVLLGPVLVVALLRGHRKGKGAQDGGLTRGSCLNQGRGTHRPCNRVPGPAEQGAESTNALAWPHMCPCPAHTPSRTQARSPAGGGRRTPPAAQTEKYYKHLQQLDKTVYCSGPSASPTQPG